jgi:ComF family protein
MAGRAYQLADLLRELYGDLLDFIYPPLCGLCHRHLNREEKNVCQDCWRSLPIITGPFCQRCGLPLAGADPVCMACRSRQPLFSFARSYGLFDERFQQIIHLFKYRRRKSLAGPLAELLSVVFRAEGRYHSMDAMVPIPLHPVKYRTRGYNQSELIARELSIIHGLAILDGALIRMVNTRSQSNLGWVERKNNVRGAFRVKDAGSVDGRRLILVDDVFTTGATASACAEPLLRAGAAEVSVLTVARTPESPASSGREDGMSTITGEGAGG